MSIYPPLPYNPAYNPAYCHNPAPTAPPAYLQNHNVAPKRGQKQLDLNDDCAICYDKLRDLPTGDKNAAVVIAKTQCHHFFHEFCLNKYLPIARRDRNNQDCPECRRQIDKHSVYLIPVEMNPVQIKPAVRPYVSPAPVEVSVHPEGPGTIARIAQGTLGVVKSILWGINNYVTAEIPDTIRCRQDEVEHRIVEMKLKWDKMPKFFDEQKEEIYMALTSIRSLIEKNSKDALKAIKTLEANTQTFEQKMKYAQAAFLKELSAFQAELN